MLFERNKMIRFHHCDPAGIVFYPQYLILCNEIVEDWFEYGIGVGFGPLHTDLKRGVPMRRLEAEFTAPGRIGEELAFTLQVLNIGRTSLQIEIVARQGDTVCFTTRQVLVWADLDGPRAIEIDDEWRERFARFMPPAQQRA